jgi:hypothetical protein
MNPIASIYFDLISFDSIRLRPGLNADDRIKESYSCAPRLMS